MLARFFDLCGALLLIGHPIYRGGLTWKPVLPMLLQTAALSSAKAL